MKQITPFAKGFLTLVILGVIGYVGFHYKGRLLPAGGAATPSSDGSVQPVTGPVVTVQGYAGGEKSGLLADPAVARILEERYRLIVKYDKRGSIEMVTSDSAGQDFLWPSSEFAAEVFRKRRSTTGAREAKVETIFNSPIVFYSWNIVVDALQAQKIVEKRGEAYFLTDATAFMKMVSSGKRWKEIGVPQLYGRVTIFSTDPNRSNSGTMFAALLATLLNDGDVVGAEAVDKFLPEIRQVFARMGHMEASSGDLFKNFLNTGVGANPMIVGYENQMIEYSIEHQDQLPLLQQSVRVLYPEPTMWSGHPLIALTDSGKRFLLAMKDPEIQRLAWERHGFRSGLMGVQNDTRLLRVVGLPPRIEAVVPMPNSEVMQRILDGLQRP